MTLLHFNLPKLATWVDRTGIVHLCFEWHNDFLDRTYWSTVCLDYDLLSWHTIDDVGHMDHATCVWCISGTAAP